MRSIAKLDAVAKRLAIKHAIAESPIEDLNY